MPRQSDTVLLEEEVLVVEVVERHPPRFLRPISVPPGFTAAALPGQECLWKERPLWQPADWLLLLLHFNSLQQPQPSGLLQSTVQLWSGLGKRPVWEEQGDNGRPWRRCGR